MNRVKIAILQVVVAAAIVISSDFACAKNYPVDTKLIAIDSIVNQLMKKGDIPGLSLIIVTRDSLIIRNYGYKDLKNKKRVDANTIFELGSCSKAFTALAIMTLVEQKQLSLDEQVSQYIPWFETSFEGKARQITVRQLLHHTSGIPWNTIAKIPSSDKKDALLQTVKKLNGQELSSIPGSKYEYATINYDVLALIIELVSDQSFEQYVHSAVFQRLGLTSTTVGEPHADSLSAKGYKLGFFEAREYLAPKYKGNNAAGYILSNAKDIGKWISFQMGMLPDTTMYSLAKATQQRDETVALHDMSSYAMGWQISLDGEGEVYHSGLNPNFSSHIVFKPKLKIGVGVLANSNSAYTSLLAEKIIEQLSVVNEEHKAVDRIDSSDRLFSILAIIVGTYILLVVAYLTIMATEVAWGRRKYDGYSSAKAKKLIRVLLTLSPFVFGIYILPMTFGGFTWESIIVWTPVSFSISIVLILSAFATTFFVYALSQFFPEKNEFMRDIPQLMLLSMLSGLANMTIIVFVTSAIGSNVELEYLIFYYMLVSFLYLFGRHYVQVQLIKISTRLTFDLRVKLIDKIFLTSFQNFESIDRGRVYTSLNDDVGTIGGAADKFVMLITNIFTIVGAFLYLSTIEFWGTLIILSCMVVLALLYYFVSTKANRYFEEARDSRDVFMNLSNMMVDGFKEISLHENKKKDFKRELLESADQYRASLNVGFVKLVNTFNLGESFMIVLMGLDSLSLPKLFPSLEVFVITSFVIVLIYLIGPLTALFSGIPSIMQFRIAWTRVQHFLKEIPASLKCSEVSTPPVKTVKSIKIRNVEFKYKGKEGVFKVGPLTFEANGGEIVFIVGGNGSGKTTMAKLVTGLYKPDNGEVLIDDRQIEPSKLGEYFSVVFSPPYLFERLYNIDTLNKTPEIAKYLTLLDLENKVMISGNRYSTINLSGGQRKRLALLQCYLEGSPIYLFDEWAADQDPAYRKFFYRNLLPQMREDGKIVIAITHDDHYFDVADKVLKMDQGVLEIYKE